GRTGGAQGRTAGAQGRTGGPQGRTGGPPLHELASSIIGRFCNLRCSTVTPESIRKLFQAVRSGQTTPDEAVERLRHLPFEDLGFAKVDHHRALRVGVPEVIFCQGKTPAQVAAIFKKLARHGNNVLATRASREQFAAVKKLVPPVKYHAGSGAIVLRRDKKRYGKGRVTVISAGTSDLPVAEEAAVTA